MPLGPQAHRQQPVQRWEFLGGKCQRGAACHTMGMRLTLAICGSELCSPGRAVTAA